MSRKPHTRRARIIACALCILPIVSFAAENAPRVCVPFDQMQELALVDDQTILVTMKGNTLKRVDLDRCTGLTKASAFSYTGAATALCAPEALPVTQAPASCAIRQIVDIGTAEAAALLVPSYEQMVRDIAQRRFEQQQPRTAVAPDSRGLAKLLGHYQIDLDLFVEFARDDGRYVYRVTRERAVELFPESATKLFATDVPVQISFERGPQDGDVQLILHRDGKELVGRQVDRTVANAAEIALDKRILQGKPDPERAAFLQQYIAAEQSGEIPTDILSPRFLPVVAHVWPSTREETHRLGKLVSLEFRRVTARGADMYAAEYEQGHIVWLVGSLTTDHKVVAITRASGASADSLEKIESLRLRLARADEALTEAGGPAPRPSDRPLPGIMAQLRPTARSSRMVLADARRENAADKREQLTFQRDQIGATLQHEEQELRRRGEVTVSPEELVQPKEPTASAP